MSILKFIIAFTLILLSFFPVITKADGAPQLLINKLNSESIIKGLPLTGREVGQSGNGKKKQRWSIKGLDQQTFEIIGDLQSDADLVGWQCVEFDPKGNIASAVREKSLCRLFFISVLKNVVTNSESLANDLLIKAEKIKPSSAVRRFADLSIETDSEFYFIRRESRR